MNEHFVVVSFYTAGTGYEASAHERLIPSLKKFDLDYRVEALPNRGDWLSNCLAKAEVIGDWMDRLAYNIVWLDADAEMCAYPRIFDQPGPKCDFAAHWRQPVNRLSSGTMFFRNCYRVRELVRHWEAQCHYATELGEEDSRRWEGPLLDKCLEAHRNIDVYHLPLSYSTIFDDEQPSGPVIVRHWQASRQLKEEVARRGDLP